jgi:dUTP pyrophosphatase
MNTNYQILKIKLLRPEAKLPTCAHPGEDAAFDIFSCENYELMAGDTHIFKVGIASELSPFYWIKVEGKSGHAARHSIGVVGGVIDAGYRDEWNVILVNHGTRPWHVCTGMTIAQCVVHNRPPFFVELVTELGQSERGQHGLGSGHQTALPIS